jgi:hypothetical protein
MHRLTSARARGPFSVAAVRRTLADQRRRATPSVASACWAADLPRETPTMGSDLPSVVPGIPNHGATVAIRHVLGLLERLGATIQRALKNAICVFHVDVEERWHRSAVDRRADHDDRVADPKLRWPLRTKAAHGTKDVLDERHESFRIIDGNPRDHGRGTHGDVLDFTNLRLLTALRIGAQLRPTALTGGAESPLRAARRLPRCMGSSCSAAAAAALLGGAPAIDHGRLSMTDQKIGSRLNPLGLSRRQVRRSVISNSLPSSFRSSSSVTTGTGNSGCSAALNTRRNRRLPERECLPSACTNASRWSPRAR